MKIERAKFVEYGIKYRAFKGDCLSGNNLLVFCQDGSQGIVFTRGCIRYRDYADNEYKTNPRTTFYRMEKASED